LAQEVDVEGARVTTSARSSHEQARAPDTDVVQQHINAAMPCQNVADADTDNGDGGDVE
jgi:hypothetical protein